MSLSITLQILGFLGATIAGSLATWQIVIDLLGRGKTSLKEDYRFAKEFFKDLPSRDENPIVTELGYQALAGDSKVTAEEVSYLLTIREPRRAMKNYIGARRLLTFFSTADTQKIDFTESYQSAAMRKTLMYFLLAVYFLSYAMGFSPLLLVWVKFVSGPAGLSLFVISSVMFFPISYFSLRTARRLSMAEALMRSQTESKGAPSRKREDRHLRRD